MTVQALEAAETSTSATPTIAPVFTVNQRDAARDRIVRLGQDDGRVVAGAAVGSLALGGGDQFSDLDLTFAVADDHRVPDVLDDWAMILGRDLEAIALVDLTRGSTTYRVFLMPDALQVDLSMAPARDFRRAGPRFRLLFGEETAAPTEVTEALPGSLFIPTPAVASDVFGWGVIYALHARACVERGRCWQAEHYVGAVRDHGLALACLRERVVAVQARGYDDLSRSTLDRFSGTHVEGATSAAIRSALRASVSAIMSEGRAALLANVEAVDVRLADLSIS